MKRDGAFLGTLPSPSFRVLIAFRGDKNNMLELSYLFYVNLQVARDTSREEKRIATCRSHKRTLSSCSSASALRPPFALGLVGKPIDRIHGRRHPSCLSCHATRARSRTNTIASFHGPKAHSLPLAQASALHPRHARPGPRTPDRQSSPAPRHACNILNAKDLRLQDGPSHRRRIDRQTRHHVRRADVRHTHGRRRYVSAFAGRHDRA